MGQSNSETSAKADCVHCDALLQENEHLKKQLREMEDRAHHDVLTGLANRRFFLDGLKVRISRCQRYGDKTALLFLDVDGLKQVNDRHGHQAGDLLLTRLAAILADNIRVSDMVARIGGDEFAVLLDNIGPAEVDQKVAFLQNLIQSDDIEFGDQHLNLSAAIGHCFVGPEDTVDDLMSRADAAMYREKRKAG
ncbi:MAG: hypothetical protein Pars2KO_23930 [Parasphingorhabdus sp.]